MVYFSPGKRFDCDSFCKVFILTLTPKWLNTMLSRLLSWLKASSTVPRIPSARIIFFHSDKYCGKKNCSISIRERQCCSGLDCLIACEGCYFSGNIEIIYTNQLPGNTTSNYFLHNTYLLKTAKGRYL